MVHRLCATLPTLSDFAPCAAIAPTDRVGKGGSRILPTPQTPRSPLPTLRRLLLRQRHPKPAGDILDILPCHAAGARSDRKSTRLNSSHQIISYAVFCLKKKKTTENTRLPLNPDDVFCLTQHFPDPRGASLFCGRKLM